MIGDDTNCGFAPVNGDLVNVATLLGPLWDNGGPTLTHALLPGSPAINAGDDSAAPATDQRGVPRPQGLRSDIGAYERGPDCAGRASTIVGTDAAETIVGTARADVIVAKGGGHRARTGRQRHRVREVPATTKSSATTGAIGSLAEPGWTC